MNAGRSSIHRPPSGPPGAGPVHERYVPRMRSTTVAGGAPGTDDIWVFGYGSLMWRPGFAFLERRRARVHGYHRAFCVLSHWHRGTPERPGLVLGLAPGGSCRGIAFRVAAANAAETVAYLDGRELVTDVYRRHWTTARTARGAVTALAYVPRSRGHRQFADKLPPARAAELLARGVGRSGPGWLYLENTVAELLREGIRDPRLLDLKDQVRAIRAGQAHLE